MTVHRLAHPSDVLTTITNALGEHFREFDVQEIADRAYAYRVDTDEQGRQILTSAGWEQIVTAEEWWQIAAEANVVDRILSWLRTTAEASPTGPVLWQEITGHEHYDRRATQSLRPRVATHDGGQIVEGSLKFEYQEPDYTWGQFVAWGHIFHVDAHGNWDVER